MAHHASAKHAGITEDWAHAIGRAKRRPAYRPTYGKHGNGHVGTPETRMSARVYGVARRLNNRPHNGRHGIPAAHPVAHRVIGTSLGKRYNPLTCANAAYQAGVRYRTVIGA